MLRKTVFLLLGAIVSLGLTACSKDHSIDPTDVADFELYLQDEMEAQNISAVSVHLFRGATVLHEAYFGLADRDANQTLTANDIFLVASVSKTITATALMQLYEQGRFALDDAINDHLPFAVNHPDSDTKITFRHLLTHTSGIKDGAALDDQYYYGHDSPVALGDFMQSYLTPAGAMYDEQDNFTKFSPGEGYEYSNTGAALMGFLVAEISGLDFNDYCKQHIFQPLGMTNSFWHLGETDTARVVRGYDFKRGDFEPFPHYTFTDYPNGGLRTNGADLARFSAAVALGGTLGNTTLLQPATVDEMLQEQVPDFEEGQGLTFYQVSTAEELWGHEGGEDGVSTVIAFNPGNQTGAVVLTNASDADVEDIVVSAYRLALKL